MMSNGIAALVILLASAATLFTRGSLFVAGFLAATTYFILYLRNPRRRSGLVSNLLLHLGAVQIVVYGGVLLRLIVLPHFALPEWVETLLLYVSDVAAVSLTLWVLFTYLTIQREQEKMEYHFSYERDDAEPK